MEAGGYYINEGAPVLPAGELLRTPDITVDGALLVACRPVLHLLGNLAQVRDVVFRRHSDSSMPEFAEGRLLIENGCVLRVDVEDVDLARSSGELCLYLAKELAQQRRLERMEQKGERRGVRVCEGESVLLKQTDRR